MREFLKGKARNFGHHIIDGWLKGCGRDAGDVIIELIQCIADGEFGGDLGNREAGCLGGERRRPGDPRIHLDYHQPAIFWIYGELDIGAACINADLTQDRN